LFGSFVVV